MYKLHLDKNELFEASIELDGASLEETFARLIVETDKWNLIFEGNIDRKGNVEIPIKKLKSIFSDDTKGELKLEVVADDTYFTPWKDSFELLRSKTVTVEVKESNGGKKKLTESTPKVTVKENKKGFRVTEKIAKSYLREVMKATLKSKGNSASKKSIKEVTNKFIKENNLNESAKRDLYGLVKESKEVIENAVRNIR